MWGSRQAGRWIAFVSLLLAFANFGVAPSLVTAAAHQDSASAVSDSASDAVAAETEPANALEGAIAAPEDEKVESERRRKLRLALLTGGLIAITGLALVLLTILGGSATRRSLRRKPLKEPPPPLEAIPAERFDEPEPDAPETNAATNEDDSAQDGGTR